ncbi:MAG TPA: ATP-dependent DNA ligase [Burkholderiales bacterium]|nr:ATP-dependent DNA ligase [Burkholderiales bacterium]
MKRFARLYGELDATTSTSAKLAALERYYAQAPAADAAWATYFLSGGKPRQVVPSRLLRDSVLRASGLDDWMLEECYLAVGDFSETVSLVLPPPTLEDDTGLAEWVEQRLAPLRGADAALIEDKLREYWDRLGTAERFLLGKLIGGAFRVGVSKLLVQRALASHSGVDAKTVAQRMMGYTDGNTAPTAERFAGLIDAADSRRESGQPYPFFLAHQLGAAPATLGDIAQWMVEWKYDGIRAQVVRHNEGTWIWSRGEELVTDRFPEIAAVGAALPAGTVIDGEILVWRDERPLPFAVLQKRIGRKTLTKAILAEAPATLVAYDLLEEAGKDIRPLPQRERRQRLESIVAGVRAQAPELALRVSPLVQTSSWDELAALRTQSRARGVEGFMLKRVDAAYGVGRTKDVGTWWKWKIDPYSVDCVLVYAQHGSGRRASLYTDFTFAVWDGAGNDRKLVPFAKAYSGLTDEEFREVDAIIRRTTIEKFGPVRSVTPTLVFELGFEGIQRSSRHKSGIAVRFPRMLRWRRDKAIAEANTLADLNELLPEATARGHAG